MARVFEESFKIMAVELSYIKGFVSAAALELGIDAGRLSKWRMDPRFNGGNLLPKNDKLSPEEQELRELKKRLKEAELEMSTADKMCSVLKVSSSSFYKWLTKKSSHREEKSKKLKQLIQDEFEKVLNLNDIHQSMSRK